MNATDAGSTNSTSGRLALQLDQLVRCTVPQCPAEKHRDLLQFAARIAGCASYQDTRNSYVDFPQSQSSLLRDLRSALAKQSSRQGAAANTTGGAEGHEVRLDELAERVLKSASLQRPQEVLKLLSHLAGSAQDEQASSRSALAGIMAESSGMTTRNPVSDPAQFVAPQTLHREGGSGIRGGSDDRNLAAHGSNLNINHRVGRSRFSQPPPSSTSLTSQSQRQRQRHALAVRRAKELDQGQLVRDVLYSFQGIDGHFVRFTKQENNSTNSNNTSQLLTANRSRSDGFHIAVSSAVSLPARDMVLKLCELGFLFRQVNGFVSDTLVEDATQQHNNNNSGSGGHNSQRAAGSIVSQTLAYALQDELTEFYRFIALLEAQHEDWQVRAQTSTDITSNSNNNKNNNNNNNTNTSNKSVADSAEATTLVPNRLTLRALYVWAKDPMRRMRLMAEIVGSVQGLRGGALASVVHSFSTHGDVFVASFVERLMTCLSVPIFRMIRQWIFRGELHDNDANDCSGGEFFITADSEVPSERMWFDRYNVDVSMVPSFIGVPLAKEILLIGKSLNFARELCNTPEWWTLASGQGMQQSDLTYRPGQGELGSDGQTAPLVVAIRGVAECTNTKLRGILFDSFDFMRHCFALKQYLMLGQGDMIQYLMDLLSTELALPAQHMHRHNLNAQLETAIRASNASNDPEFVLERLDVHVLEASAGDTGWDVFLLTYQLDEPLNAVITDEAMQRYHQIFSYLWRLKRVEYTLSSTWKQHTTAAHKVRGMMLPGINQVLHRSHLLRNEMIHFVSNLHSYIMFEVLESSWTQFESDLKEAKNLDEIIQAHDRYLDSVTAKTLIGDGGGGGGGGGEAQQTYGDDLFSALGGQSSFGEDGNGSIMGATGAAGRGGAASPGAAGGGGGIDVHALREHLYELFDLVIRFCSVQDSLYTAVLETVHRKRQRDADIYENTKAGRWGIEEVPGGREDGDIDGTGGSGYMGDDTGNAEAQERREQERTASEFGRQLRDISAEYHDCLKAFLIMLQPTASDNLRFLTFRLDFNHFYGV